MPFGTYEAPIIEKVPTFLQFIKTAHVGIEGKTKFAVDIIWLPGKFNNVTLQTNAFRYIVDEKHPLFADVQLYRKELNFDVENLRMEIVVTSIKQRTIEVVFNSRKPGNWAELGSNAIKFTTR